MNETLVEGPVVVADVGATNARFGVAGSAGIEAAKVYATAEASTGDALVERYLAEVRVDRPGAIVVALAGPVGAGRGELTNSPVGFTEAGLRARFRAPALLLNDFAAVAAAVPFLEKSQLFDLAGARAAPFDPGRRAVKALLGPGTGLGMAAVLPVGERWLVLPSEGGHCDLPATDALEAEVLGILLKGGGQVPWEACLSGPGLLNLYRIVCRIWGCAPVHEHPERVVTEAAGSDPVCHQTVEMFLGMLGNAAGNLAVMTCARGGVLIGGGIVPKLLDQLDPALFRRRFEQRGVLTAFAEGVPTVLITDSQIGLVGAWRALRGDVGFVGSDDA